jgi:hypothetical protein
LLLALLRFHRKQFVRVLFTVLVQTTLPEDNIQR